jgi:hypothetical protein
MEEWHIVGTDVIERFIKGVCISTEDVGGTIAKLIRSCGRVFQANAQPK